MENRQLSLFDNPEFVGDPYFDYLVNRYNTLRKLVASGKYDFNSLFMCYTRVFHELNDRGYFVGKFLYPKGKE